MKYFVRLMVAAAAAAFAVGPAPAAAQQAPTAEAALDIYARYRENPNISTEQLENGLWRARLPLAALRSSQGAIHLDGASASEEISFAIAPQADVTEARIVLRHVSGRAQEGLKPQLRLGMNGFFIGQLDGVTERAAAINEIVLDPSALVSGYNTLRIDAVQRYTLDCQDADAAELWTEIDTARSYIEVTYARRPLAATLADLGAVLSAGIGGVDKLGILAGQGDADTLRRGALASQAVGNRLGYRLPEITQLTEMAPGEATEGRDLIAIGTPEELAAFAPDGLARLEDRDAWLSIGPSPFDPTHFLILAAGRTPEAIDGALRALASEGFPLAAASSAVIAQSEVPATIVSAKRQPLRTDAKYVFRDLGFGGVSVLGREQGRAQLSFTLPADVRFRDDDDLVMMLDFAYGAGLDGRSVVNILVNGSFERAVRMTNPDGEVVPGYQIDLPARSLRPGWNTVDFQIEMSAPEQGACAARNSRNLAFTLKDTSTLTLPAAGRFAELPSLSLLQEAGYPFSGLESAPMAIRAVDASPETIESVWTLAARLGQINGTVFTEADFGIGPELADANTILVGTRPQLGGFLPLQKFSLPETGGFSRELNLVDLGDNGLIIEGESPEYAGRLVMLVTAETEEQLIGSIRALVKPSHWSQLSGGAAVWRENAATIVSKAADATFTVGDKALGARKTARATSWGWIVSIAAILFAMAAGLALIARYMRTRINGK
ncbi:cellulose biosynthesis cyclic di-GMP-binding regulatory protein BcsB [Hyphomonas sp. WL0036]|uniref:cellulose biosynthesis cyclic di-GMP-binding regulatory protein BcsB n=1 Tax=Hyphomonas sediminis TaxID=2866160 RepID=UPI001C7F10B9|nr:cellulose biosynthesis cyclic di-GMP-binding regulatory protein BcsB [Hyphomonas sediminis]MBY9065731.1 cellulose biosynthesis cyclic di-GMP-binding regulatory protein BcsB [Hyphomonas sediminis]